MITLNPEPFAMLRHFTLSTLLLGTLVGCSASASSAQQPEPAPAAVSAAAAPLVAEASKAALSGKWEAGLDAGTRAAAAAREAGDAEGEARAERIRAECLGKLGRKDDARAAWAAAASAGQRAGNPEEHIQGLIGQVLYLPSGSPEARRLIEQATATAEGEMRRPRAAAQGLHDLASRLISPGRLDEAEILELASLRLWERHAPGTPQAAQPLRILGIIYSQRGDFDRAEQVMELALAIDERVSPGSADVASDLNTLSGLNYRRGDLAKAEDFARRSIEIRERIEPETDSLGVALGNLANVYTTRGDLALAQHYLLRALKLFEKTAGPDSLRVAFTLNNLGAVATRFRDLQAATDFITRALAIVERLAPDSIDAASLHQNLGTLLRSREHNAAALEHYQRAQAIYERKAPNLPYAITLLSMIGELERELKRYDSALEHHRKALAVLEERAPGTLFLAEVYGELGRTYNAKGEYRAAQEYLERAVILYRRLAPRSLETATCLRSLAESRRQQGDHVGGEKDASASWSLIESLAASAAEDAVRLRVMNDARSIAQTVAGARIEQNDIGGALAILERTRAWGLQYALWERNNPPRGVTPQLWKEYNDTLSAQDRAENAASSAANALSLAEAARDRVKEAPPAQRDELVAEAAKAAQRHRDAQVQADLVRQKVQELGRQVRASAPASFPRPFSVSALKALLPKLAPGTVVAFFSIADANTGLFLLTVPHRKASAKKPPAAGKQIPRGPAAEMVVYSLGLSRTELEKRLRVFRAAVSGEKTDAIRAGRELFARLFPGPSGPAVRNARRVIVMPDGPLWDVPFAALVMSPAGVAPRYLGLEKPLSLSPSFGLLEEALVPVTARKAGSRPVALAVGDPVFQHRPAAAATPISTQLAERAAQRRSVLFGGPVPPDRLPGTRADAESVARLYGATPLLGEAATESAVRGRIAGADVVHLATHGYLHPFRAMDSGVLLTAAVSAKAGDTTNDGALQAWEIYSQLRLKAELVVLAACETGRGEEVGADPLVGLTRALLIAGARSVVASQWQVRDDSTRTLMAAFHRRLRVGVDKDEALRAAMQEVAERGEWRHPFHWSGFVLLGRAANGGLGAK